MFQLIVTRATIMGPVLVMLSLGVLAAQRPAAWLLIAYAAYRTFRAGGLGLTLGYAELARLDCMVVGGLLAMNGLYALLCRGVQLSGMVCMAILTALFIKSCHDANERVGWLARAVIVMAWAALTYRLDNPVTSWLWCCCRSVG